MNVFDVDVKKLSDALEKEGITPEEARAKLAEAFPFLIAVRTNQLAKKMLPDAIIVKQRDLTTKLAEFIGQYRKSGMPGIAAQVYKNALPAGIDSLNIILTCEELTRLGVIKEWNYLVGTRQWQEIRRSTDPTKQDQKVFIHKDVLNVGVHIFDFRKGKMYNRHFLPADWHNKAQVELCQALATAAKTAKEAYDAAHPKPKTAVALAMEKAVAEKAAAETATPSVTPVEAKTTEVATPDLSTVIEETPSAPAGGIRFAEDIPEVENRRGKKNKKDGKKRQRHNPDEEGEE